MAIWPQPPPPELPAFVSVINKLYLKLAPLMQVRTLHEDGSVEWQNPATGEGCLFAVGTGSLTVPDGFRAEAAMAKRLGFVGKSCIHPRQVSLANAAFMPDAEEIESARRIVAAASEAASAGRGAFVVDGRMVDLPFLKRAHAILAVTPPNPSQS